MYDPRMKTEKGNLMTVHEMRFSKLTDNGVPGPGAYTVCTALASNRCFHVYKFHFFIRLIELFKLQEGTEAVRKSAIQVQYSYNNITQKFCCIAAVWTVAIQLQYRFFLQLLQVTCKFSASCRKPVLQRCIAGVCTSAIQLQYRKKFLYCSCIVVVLHLCGPLYADVVVAGVSRVINGSVWMCVCVTVYVSTITQKPLDISSPNLASG